MRQHLLPVVDERQVVLDVSLRRQHQRLRPLTGRQRRHVLGDQAVQPAEPVRAGDAQDRSVRQVHRGETPRERPLLGVGVAVVRRDTAVRRVGGDGSRAGQQRAAHD